MKTVSLFKHILGPPAMKAVDVVGMTHLMTMKAQLVALILLLPLAAAAQSIFLLKISVWMTERNGRN
jgi:hypothetical protein